MYRKNPIEQLQGLVISVPTWIFPIRPHQIGKAQIKGQGVHDHERKNKGSSPNSSLDEVSVRETKQEWLPQKGFSGLKIYQGITTGTHKTGLWSSTIPPQIFHIPSSHQKLLSLQTTIKKTTKVHHSTCSIYLLTYSLVLAQNAMCVKPSDLLTRYVPSLWKLSHEKNQP